MKDIYPWAQKCKNASKIDCIQKKGESWAQNNTKVIFKTYRK